MLQFEVLVLEMGQFHPDSLEGGFRKLEIGQVDVPPGLCVAGTYIVVWLWGVTLLGSGMGTNGGGSGTAGSPEDSSVSGSVASASGPSLYMTSSSAIVRASSSASLMQP